MQPHLHLRRVPRVGYRMLAGETGEAHGVASGPFERVFWLSPWKLLLCGMRLR